MGMAQSKKQWFWSVAVSWLFLDAVQKKFDKNTAWQLPNQGPLTCVSKSEACIFSSTIHFHPILQRETNKIQRNLENIFQYDPICPRNSSSSSHFFYQNIFQTSHGWSWPLIRAGTYIPPFHCKEKRVLITVNRTSKVIPAFFLAPRHSMCSKWITPLRRARCWGTSWSMNNLQMGPLAIVLGENLWELFKVVSIEATDLKMDDSVHYWNKPNNEPSPSHYHVYSCHKPSPIGRFLARGFPPSAPAAASFGQCAESCIWFLTVLHGPTALGGRIIKHVWGYKIQ